MRKFLKKLLKFIAVTSAILFALLLFVFMKYSNFDGYCKEVGRVLTEQELIERAGLSDKYKENPYCCDIGVGGGWMYSETEDLFNMFTGYYHYFSILLYKQNPVSEIDAPYYEETLVLDECGHALSVYGGQKHSQEYYNTIIKLRKTY